MPIFSDRRLFSMLDNISSLLSSKKYNEIVADLRHSDTNTALAAEGELAVLWATNQVAHLEPEPILPHSTRRPDARSNNLFASGPAVVEVRTLSDESFSGKEAMDRTANIISGYADQIRKGASSHLFFEFNERSYYTTRFHRERCIDPKFELTEDIKKQLRDWISDDNWPNPKSIQIIQGASNFVISWKQTTVHQFRTFSRMPPVAYDLEDNPIFKALKKKTKQVRGVEQGTLKCIALMDAGCDLLRRLRPIGAIHEIGGEEIILHALRKLSIDSVIVFSPYRESPTILESRRPIYWNVSCFDRRGEIDLEAEYERIKKLANELPAPHYEGYQARDIHKQGGFSPKRRKEYLPTNITTWGTGGMTIKLSATLLHDYLAGRVNFQNFKDEAFRGENNLFESEMIRGNSITNVTFESGGIDEDDDYIIFELDISWQKIERKIKRRK